MMERSVFDGMPVHAFEMRIVNGNEKKVPVRIVWKISFRCKHCNEPIGNCYCFSTEAKMLAAKVMMKDRMICSTVCDLNHMTRDEVKDLIELVKKQTYWSGEDSEDYPNDWNDLDSVAEWMDDRISEYLDEDYAAENMGADEECPIDVEGT
jgi:hypothetical protein